MSGEIWQALGTMFGAVAALFAWLSKRHAKNAEVTSIVIEDAVNHRHRHDRKDGYDVIQPPRLYDLAIEAREQRAALMDRVERLEDASDDNYSHHGKIFERLDDLDDAIAAHVEWEESVKWHEIDSVLHPAHPDYVAKVANDAAAD